MSEHDGQRPPQAAAPSAAHAHLKTLRDELDAIDGRIVEAIGQRLATVKKIVDAKSGRSAALRDPAREHEVLAKVEARARAQGVSGPLVRRIFADVIAHSVSMQATTLSGTGHHTKEVHVALVGGAFSYDYLAAEQYLGGRGIRGSFTYSESFKEAASLLEQGKVELLFVPIENTFAGSLNQVYDLLRTRDLAIVGEESFKIDHALCAPEGADLADIRRVYSHPQVLEQCSAFLEANPQIRAVATHNTGEALGTVADSGAQTQAVIASPAGASAHGLVVMSHGIGNQENIQSRFVALATQPLNLDPRVPAKTSLILSARHEHGALVTCLQVLSDHGVSLTKIESRPRADRPWEYTFFIDFEGHVDAPNVREALDVLRAQASFLKVLGCYPAKATPREVQTAVTHSRTRSVKDKTPIHSRETRTQGTQIRVEDLLIGGDSFTVMAGPAQVESGEQIDRVAAAVRDAHAQMLFAGVFAPPDQKEEAGSLGEVGLELLAQAGKNHGLATATEVLSAEQVERAARHVHVLVVGESNTQNFALLREVSRVDRPIVLVRGPSNSIDEWLAAAEFVLSHGNGQVVLCERGIRTFESATRHTLDLSAVPVLASRTHLPVLVDPSRGTGNSNYVIPLARAARAVGAHGLWLEVGDNVTDGTELSPAQLSDLMSTLHEGS